MYTGGVSPAISIFEFRPAYVARGGIRLDNGWATYIAGQVSQLNKTQPNKKGRMMNKFTGVMTAAVTFLAASTGGGAVSAATGDAAAILEKSGVQGGLIGHVGCGDGTLTTALRRDDGYIVHGLDRSAANVDQARKHVRSQGLAGKISISRLYGDRMPFVDHFVNLVVVDDATEVSDREIMRVLVPGGVMLVKNGNAYSQSRKPLSEDRDEWTHYLHGCDNNAVSTDKLVGPPKHMQFRTGMEWSRLHHKLASVSGVVTAGGRLFYVMDGGPGANLNVPARWQVVARDAYNGTLLWRRPIRSWTSHQRGFRSGPVQLPRLIVTDGRRVYVPLSISEPLVALDAATGQTAGSYPEATGTEEILVSNGTLLVVAGSPSPTQAAELRGAEKTTSKKIVAYDAAGGDLLWKTEDLDPSKLIGCTLAADRRQVYYQFGSGEVCLDIKTGKQVWSTAGPDPEPGPKAAEPVDAGKAKKATGRQSDKKKKVARPKGQGGGLGPGSATLVVRDGVVLSQRGSNLVALSAEDGKRLWSGGCGAGFRSPGDVFVIDGLVWTGKDFAAGRDLKTGEVRKTLPVLSAIQTAGHHHRCYREKATTRYIMAGHRGIEYMDLEGDDHCRNNWIRGLCQYGVMPANGLTYAPPHSCGCYMEAKLNGFWAVAAERENWKIDAEADVLEKGPAYGDTSGRAVSEKDQWPTLRGNAARSGVAEMELPQEPAKLWQVKLGTRLSSPVAAAGLVLAADIDSGTVHAVDAADGKPRWSYATGSRVDSPPTVCGGAAIFGGRDGWVYCLRLADGQLAWRLRAAPADVRTVDMDRVESLWPVCGSVLVQNGLVYCCAGRNTYLDEGLFLYALDPATGKVVHRRRFKSERPGIFSQEEADDLRSKHPSEKISQNTVDFRTFVSPDKSDSFSMDGNMNDVISGDGEHVFLRHLTFDSNWQRSGEMLPHLFSTSHLTDGNENHRSHWCIGRGFFGRTVYAYPWIPERFGKQLNYPLGLMFAYSGRQAWGIQRTASGAGTYVLFGKEIPAYVADDPAYKNDLIRTGGNWTWNVNPGMRPRAILMAAKSLVLGGMPSAEPGGPFAAFEGRKGGLLKIFSASDGELSAELELDSPVVWDGMAAAGGKLFLSTTDGSIVCLGK